MEKANSVLPQPNFTNGYNHPYHIEAPKGPTRKKNGKRQYVRDERRRNLEGVANENNHENIVLNLE